MARLNIPDSTEAPESTRSTLAAVERQLGFTPALYRLMSNSPAVLAGFTALQGSLAKALDAKTRHSISLAVSTVNDCGYCLTAHTYVAAIAGKMSREDIALACEGSSEDPRRAAAAQFAKQVIEARGNVDEQDLASVRNAGYDDKQIIEITALAAQFLLTNFLNNVAGTEPDFPSLAESNH
jgi:uncharacterized peroxidase-related enzyme